MMRTPQFLSCFLISPLLFWSGCGKTAQEKAISEAVPFTVTNLYPIERLPVYFNRVVVMPCSYEGSARSILDFVDDLVNQELAQARLFETVRLSTGDCRRLFGKERLSSADSLPDNFLSRLISETQANGVLFVDIQHFQPYRPLSLGVRAKLVDLNSGDFMWAVDETLDSAHASVIASAQIYQNRNHVRALSQKTTGSVLHSPRNFTKFVAHTLFASLPTR